MTVPQMFGITSVLAVVTWLLWMRLGKSPLELVAAIAIELLAGFMLLMVVRAGGEQSATGDHPVPRTTASVTPSPVATPRIAAGPLEPPAPSLPRTTEIPRTERSPAARAPRVWTAIDAATLPYRGPETELVRKLLSHYTMWTISGDRSSDHQVTGSTECGSESALLRAAQAAWAAMEASVRAADPAGHDFAKGDFLVEERLDIAEMRQRLRTAVYQRAIENRKAITAAECEGVDWDWMDFVWLQQQVGEYDPAAK
jgi:hypothetical protein